MSSRTCQTGPREQCKGTKDSEFLQCHDVKTLPESDELHEHGDSIELMYYDSFHWSGGRCQCGVYPPRKMLSASLVVRCSSAEGSGSD